MELSGVPTFAGRWRRAVTAAGDRPFLLWEGSDGAARQWSYEQARPLKNQDGQFPVGGHRRRHQRRGAGPGHHDVATVRRRRVGERRHAAGQPGCNRILPRIEAHLPVTRTVSRPVVPVAATEPRPPLSD